jgi:predicted metalloprotease with PDZ domain
MSDAAERLAHALRDRINEAVQAAVGRQHRVRTTPVPAKAAQTHQDDDNAGGDGGRPRRALVQSMVGARAQPIGGVCEGWVTSR